MIVSASRRTDLPALYPLWLGGRVAAGAVEVANPFRPGQVRRVDLRPTPEGTLDALVLWTRNPGPMLPHLPAWERLGIRSLWLVTVTGYPKTLEPAAPRLPAVLPRLRELARIVGPGRITWRYDPVLLAPGLGMDRRFHRENFHRLAGQLAHLAGRCVFSAFDDYAKTRRRMKDANATPGDRAGAVALLAELATVAAEHGLSPQSCAEEAPPVGVAPGACIDKEQLRKLWGLDLPSGPDPGQRRHCRCTPSVDIGAYDTCVHGCLYCYATGAPRSATERRGSLHPGRPRLA